VPPLSVFTSARAALEGTRGTDLTPTRLIYGEEITHSQEIATIRPTERRASYNPVYSAAAGPERNNLHISGRMSFTDLIWYGNLFFKGVATGTGAGADKTWTFLPTANADDVKTATVQLGDAVAIGASTPGVKLNYCFGQTFNLHWEKNDDGAVTFAADFLAAKAASQITAFTGSLTDRVTVPASANGTTAYIDTTTIGSTADTSVIAVDFNLDLAPVPLYTLDGTTAAKDIYRPDFRRWTATITRQYTTKTEWDKYVDKGIRKVRIKTVGGTIPTTANPYSLQLDLYGAYTNRESAEVDGIVTEVLTLEQVYDTTATADHSLTVVNDVASIT
jgi:hypothetical protein